MNAFAVSITCLVILYLAYRFYSKYLSQKIFGSDRNDLVTPSHEFEDGIDFVPTPKSVLFGHHFSSIAGAAPILGPAIAIIWGWVPALIWIVFGSIFIGAVHDFGSLVLSVLFKGRSVGSITGDILGKRSRFLFLFIIFILVFIVIAVFAYIIATLFVMYPGSVIPINFQILVALYIGYRVKKRKSGLLFPSIIALILLYVMIYVGNLYPLVIPVEYSISGSPVLTWMMFLLLYGYVAAVLPVTALLQPRDYINSHQLILGLLIIYLGMFVAQPVIVAPAINIINDDVSWFPYLFITIACGAVSGFHALVSTGTTSKQLDKLEDARSIGYGSMIGEATLAIAATIAVASGFENTEAWMHHYSSFEGAQGLSSKLGAFVSGTSAFVWPIIQFFGFEAEGSNLAAVFISVLVISFAATSLDTAVRIQRYVVGEIARAMKLKMADNRFITTAWAVFFSLILVLSDNSGSGGLILWPLFGTTNQLLAALTLMVISIWLFVQKRNYWLTLLPLSLLLVIVTIAAIYNITYYAENENYALLTVAILIIVCHLWLLFEGFQYVRKIVSSSGH